MRAEHLKVGDVVTLHHRTILRQITAIGRHYILAVDWEEGVGPKDNESAYPIDDITERHRGVSPDTVLTQGV